MNDEYIKILEELKASLSKNIERLYDNDISTTMYNIFSLRKRQGQAIENLLNRNKELEEIEQEHKKENGELREKVAALEEENTVLKKANNISENITIKDITNFMNKSLEDFNKEYIPVSKIKEKIELMQESIVNEDYSDNTNLVNCSVFDTNIVISYLLELLEEK